MLAGMTVLMLVPMQYRAKLAAIVAKFPADRALTLVHAKAPGTGIVADVAGLNDDEILAVVGVRAVAIDRDLAADPAMVEWKGTEMLGDQDDRISLAFVGAKCPRWHHSLALKSERQTVIVQAGNELTVPHHAIVKSQVINHAPHQVKPPQSPRRRILPPCEAARALREP
jgi:hypothetical protein